MISASVPSSSGSQAMPKPLSACATTPSVGLNRNSHKTAGDRRRHCVGPDEQRLVDRRAADDAVGHHREHERDRQTERRDQRTRRWPSRGTTRGSRGRRSRSRKLSSPTNCRVSPNASCTQHRLVDRLAGRQEEEDDGDRDLRRDQRVRQPAGLEADALFGGHSEARRPRSNV